MIPLGSCTMKLNATVEMIPVTWPEFGKAASLRARGPVEGLRADLPTWRRWLAEITGFAAVSLQPNAGSQGEYAGPARHPRVSQVARRHASQRLPHPHERARHQPGLGRDRGHEGRARRVRQPTATSTSPISRRAAEHKDNLAALMVTYPSARTACSRRRSGHLQDRPRSRRAGVHGRREHERAGRPHQPRLDRRRRLPPQSPQDLLHPARRRRPGHGPDRRRGRTWPVPPRTPRVSPSDRRFVR
jgi:hypothetical protein